MGQGQRLNSEDSAQNPRIELGQKGSVKGTGVFCETVHSSSTVVSTWHIIDPWRVETTGIG